MRRNLTKLEQACIGGRKVCVVRRSFPPPHTLSVHSSLCHSPTLRALGVPRFCCRTESDRREHSPHQTELQIHSTQQSAGWPPQGRCSEVKDVPFVRIEEQRPQLRREKRNETQRKREKMQKIKSVSRHMGSRKQSVRAIIIERLQGRTLG